MNFVKLCRITAAASSVTSLYLSLLGLSNRITVLRNNRVKDDNRKDKAMRKFYLLLATITVAFLLEGCSTRGQSTTQVASNFINRQQVVTTTKETYPAKNPKAVAVYTPDKTPHAPYRVIGVATVSKYNLLGMQRKDDTVHDMMKKLAASVGGDGLINMSTGDESIQANIIAFQKIMI
jgi:hypothetical protein